MTFPRYAEYKESGVAWLGEVPGHWEVQRLKHNLRLLTDKTDRRTFPVVLENIESWSGQFIPSDTEFEGEGVAFVAGDILFGKLLPYLSRFAPFFSNFSELSKKDNMLFLKQSFSLGLTFGDTHAIHL